MDNLYGKIGEVNKTWNYPYPDGPTYSSLKIVDFEGNWHVAVVKGSGFPIGTTIYANGRWKTSGQGYGKYFETIQYKLSDEVHEDKGWYSSFSFEGVVKELVAYKKDSDWKVFQVEADNGNIIEVSSNAFGDSVEVGSTIKVTGTFRKSKVGRTQLRADSFEVIKDAERIEQGNVKTLEGTVLSIDNRKDNGWKVVSVRSGNRVIKAKGMMPEVRAGMHLKANGALIDDRFGRVFAVKTHEFSLPSEQESIVKFLKDFVPGLGEKGATAIFNNLGSKTVDILTVNPRAALKGVNITQANRAKIIEAFEKSGTFLHVAAKLSGYGLGEARIRKLFEMYGAETEEYVKSSRYNLIDEVHGMGFKLVDQMALSYGVDKDAEDRIQAGVIYALDNAASSGNTCVQRDVLVRKTSLLLDVNADKVENAINTMLSSTPPRIRYCDGMIYHPDLYYYERRTADLLLRKAENNSTSRVRVNFEAIERQAKERYGHPIALDVSQKDAVTAAVSNNVSIITGGPGTGKTLTINAVISAAEAGGAKVLLASPTGRAAKRMAEMTGHEASTVHRLLEFHDGHFARNADNRLEGDMLIIDETSMLDVAMTTRLLEAVPSGMKVVFVGDSDQLPSVGPGTVFMDMIDSGRFNVTRLNRVHRQGEDSGIVLNAQKINAGDPELDFSNQDFQFFAVTSEEEASSKILELATKTIPEKYGYKSTDIQILPAIRKEGTLLGTSELNRSMQAIVMPDDTPSLGRYHVGDRVMQTKNDYEKGVFNGNFGVVASTDSLSGKLVVDFEDAGRVEYERDELDNLDLAYAVTTHKAQGSEFPAVIIPVWKGSSSFILDRNLLYTAVTRASKLCFLVGDPDAIQEAVQKRNTEKRTSLLLRRMTGDIVDNQPLGPERVSYEAGKKEIGQAGAAGRDVEADKPETISFRDTVIEKDIKELNLIDRIRLQVNGCLDHVIKGEKGIFLVSKHPSDPDKVLFERTSDAMRTLKKRSKTDVVTSSPSFIYGRALRDRKTGKYLYYDVASGKIEYSETHIPVVVTLTFLLSKMDGKPAQKRAVAEQFELTGRIDGLVTMDGKDWVVSPTGVRDIVLLQDPSVVKELVAKTKLPKLTSSMTAGKTRDNLSNGFGFFAADGVFYAFDLMKKKIVPAKDYDETLREVIANNELQKMKEKAKQRLDMAKEYQKKTKL